MYKKVASGKTISHPTKGLTAIETRFGWSVGGNTIDHSTSGNIEPSSPHIPSSTKSHFREIKLKAFTLTTTEVLAPMVRDQDADPTEVEIKDMIETIFDTEGTPDDLEKDKLTVDQRYAVDQFQETVQKIGKQYFVQPLFKKDVVPMMNNYPVALRRYNLLRKQLAKHLH